MATVKGPDFIALQVRDLDVSADFYSKKVGLQLAPQSPPDARLFKTMPIPFAVRKPQVDLSAVPKLGHGVALWFLCDNSPELYAQLKARGVEILSEPIPGPFGLTFQFKDPDGYIITVHDRP